MSDGVITPRQGNYSTDPNPQSKVNAGNLETEMQNRYNNEQMLLRLVNLILRDDNTLRDALVRLRSLHSEVTAVVASAGVNSWQPKANIDLCSTVDIPSLVGQVVIDGVLTTSNRVLLTAQADPSTNGPWVTDNAGDWTRAAEEDTAEELARAFFVVDGAGVANNNTAWVVQENAGQIGTLGVGGIHLTKFSAIGEQGEQGPIGVAILTGTDVPDSSIGIDGQLYIRTITGVVYVKTAGVWVESFTMSPGLAAGNIADLPAPSLAQDGLTTRVKDAYGGSTLAYNDRTANEWLRAYDRQPVWHSPDFAGRRMSLGVPLYSYPPAVWSDYITVGMPGIFLAILNPNSGPGSAPDPGYVTAYAALRAKGTLVLGYVHTSYGTRDPAEVKAEILLYKLWYPQVSGIFFDEVGDEGSPAVDDPVYLYYADLWNFVLTNMPYPQQFVALNPGATIAERFMDISSAIILYEDIADNYLTHDNPEWLLDFVIDPAKRKRIWHLIHTVGSAAQMRNLFDRARELGVGTLYITSDVLPNPWDALSAYHTEQLAKFAETDDDFAVIDIPGRASEWWASAATTTAITSGVVNAVLNNDIGASGYSVGDEFDVVGGTGTAARIKVLAIDGSGGPTRIGWTPGDYSVDPGAQDFGGGFKVNLTMAATALITAHPDAAAIPNALTSSGESRPFTVAGPGADAAARFTGIQKLYTPSAWHDQRAIGGRTMWMVCKTYLADGVLMGGNSNQWGIYAAGAGLTISYQAGSFWGGTIDTVGEWAIIVAIFDSITGRYQLRVNGAIASNQNPGVGGNLPDVVALGDYADGGATTTGNATHADIVAAGVYNRAITDDELASLEAALAARTGIVLG